MAQLLEVEGLRELCRAVVKGLGAQLGGPLGGMQPVQEDVVVAVGAERRVGQAVALRPQPPAVAARVVRSRTLQESRQNRYDFACLSDGSNSNQRLIGSKISISSCQWVGEGGTFVIK